MADTKIDLSNQKITAEKQPQHCPTSKVWSDKKRVTENVCNRLVGSVTAGINLLLIVIIVLVTGCAVCIRNVILVSSMYLLFAIFFVHEALLIADLTSAEMRTFWMWATYLTVAPVALILPYCITTPTPKDAMKGFFWVAFHVIATAASAIAHFVNAVNTSNIVPSMTLGKELASFLPLPAKELSIIGTTVILVLVSFCLLVIRFRGKAMTILAQPINSW